MAKKRKHEAVTGPADENGMEQEAQLPKQHTSGSRVEAETVSYLTDVSEHFASLSSAGDKELLMANVLEEIQGRELKIAADAVTSRLLERLLTGASPSQLIQFLQAFTNVDMMFSLAGSAFGSHVAEKTLAGLHKQADHLDEQQAADLQELLSAMVGAIGSHLYDYIMDKHATHVARALLVVIAGRDVLSPVAKKKQQQQQQFEEEEGTEGAAAGSQHQKGLKSSRSSLQEKLEGNRQQQQPIRFPELLRRCAKMLPIYDASNMALLGKNSYSSPFLQAMLRAAAHNEELLLLLLPPVLGVDAAKAAAAEPGSVLATLTDSHVGRLLRDDCYSHLLEVAVALLPPSGNDLGQEFYQRFLKGRLLPLTNHHSANFVIQAWLSALSSPQQVQDVLQELKPHLCDILKRRRSGVVAALVAAAARAGPGAHQAAVIAALADALGGLPQCQGRTGTDHLAPALMTLDTSVQMGLTTPSTSSSQQQQQQQRHHGSGYAGRLSTPGCAILTTLLTLYAKKVAKPFIASVAALSPADAVHAARDPSGSRVLQGFVEGSAGREAKSALLQKLAGSWGDIALQAAGSFFLEKAYAWADLDHKETIVSELSARQSRLMSSCHWGPLLAKKLGLEAYQRSATEWRKRAASATAAKRAFEEMLTTEDGQAAGAAAAAAAGPTSSRKRRKERKQQQRRDQQLESQAGQHNGRQYNEQYAQQQQQQQQQQQAEHQEQQKQGRLYAGPGQQDKKHNREAAPNRQEKNKLKSAEQAAQLILEPLMLAQAANHHSSNASYAKSSTAYIEAAVPKKKQGQEEARAVIQHLSMGDLAQKSHIVVGRAATAHDSYGRIRWLPNKQATVSLVHLF